jgi:hypothetical protein
MATKIRTYSKKNPVSALLKKPLAPVLDLDDELDAIMSCDNDGQRKDKDPAEGKENSPNVNKHVSNEERLHKDKRPYKKAKNEHVSCGEGKVVSQLVVGR